MLSAKLKDHRQAPPVWLQMFVRMAMTMKALSLCSSITHGGVWVIQSWADHVQAFGIISKAEGPQTGAARLAPDVCAHGNDNEGIVTVFVHHCHAWAHLIAAGCKLLRGVAAGRPFTCRSVKCVPALSVSCCTARAGAHCCCCCWTRTRCVTARCCIALLLTQQVPACRGALLLQLLPAYAARFSEVVNSRLLTQQHRERRGALLQQLLDAYAVRYSEVLDGRSCHIYTKPDKT